MIRLIVLSFFIIVTFNLHAQTLRIKDRKANPLSGSQFAILISDSTLSLASREDLIFREFTNRNIPSFFTKLVPVQIKKEVNGIRYTLLLYVTADYFSIGNDTDFVYMPVTPMLAQRMADSLSCMLPTKLMVDEIYRQAHKKLAPIPFEPNNLMTTVPVFKNHSDSIGVQFTRKKRKLGDLVAGNKKDVITSNKIYGQSTPRVVIYGWHQLNGKAIQPVYHKHIHTWVDYSHGLRLVYRKANLNGKIVDLFDVLRDPILHSLISDEGLIENGKYPTE